MISILLKFLEALDFKHDWIYFLPYQTINNLLSRCFLSFESYQKYVTDNKRAYIPETGKKFEFLTFGSDKIIEQLVARSFIIHSINCLKNNMASQISIRHIIYLIQSLIALTADKTFIYLLSINKKFFSEAFQKYLIDTCSKNPDNPQIGTLLKCAEILRTKVNKDFNKTYSLELEELLSKSKKRKSDDSQN
ncbi:hypothetical protein RF11_07728 [Thelohanellus kitauei]|uniref:Uncharacterized protein n=1 Tax=Thelohanellus kitauei TaxID=669202 RepID=A0A0C2MSW3_THEKT|nr:hypothetical protein RF11_07728 [Thelohanellus kitauei]